MAAAPVAKNPLVATGWLIPFSTKLVNLQVLVSVVATAGGFVAIIKLKLLRNATTEHSTPTQLGLAASTVFCRNAETRLLILVSNAMVENPICALPIASGNAETELLMRISVRSAITDILPFSLTGLMTETTTPDLTPAE